MPATILQFPKKQTGFVGIPSFGWVMFLLGLTLGLLLGLLAMLLRSIGLL